MPKKSHSALLVNAAPQPTGLRAYAGLLKLLGHPEILIMCSTASGMRCSPADLIAVNATQSTSSCVASLIASLASADPVNRAASASTAMRRTFQSG